MDIVWEWNTMACNIHLALHRLWRHLEFYAWMSLGSPEEKECAYHQFSREKARMTACPWMAARLDQSGPIFLGSDRTWSRFPDHKPEKTPIKLNKLLQYFLFRKIIRTIAFWGKIIFKLEELRVRLSSGLTWSFKAGLFQPGLKLVWRPGVWTDLLWRLYVQSYSTVWDFQDDNIAQKSQFFSPALI